MKPPKTTFWIIHFQLNFDSLAYSSTQSFVFISLTWTSFHYQMVVLHFLSKWWLNFTILFAPTNFEQILKAILFLPTVCFASLVLKIKQSIVVSFIFAKIFRSLFAVSVISLLVILCFRCVLSILKKRTVQCTNELEHAKV